MNKSIYFQDRTEIQKLYYDFRAASAPDVRFFPFISEAHCDYLGRYELMKEFHHHLHPFQFVEPGDCIVHVGFNREYLYKGMSFPLILASIAGREGRVLAIEADDANSNALAKYVDENCVSNLLLARGAVWKSETKLRFMLDDDWSPCSVARDVPGFAAPSESGARRSRETVVSASPLDVFVTRYLDGASVDVLSLTVNGAEQEVLDGAASTLERAPNIRIALALSFQHFSYETRKDVCERLAHMGFKIAVGDAPHDPWSAKPFFFACAIRCSEDELTSRGFERSSWHEIEAAANGRLAEIVRRRAGRSRGRNGNVRRWTRKVVARVKHKVLQKT